MRRTIIVAEIGINANGDVEVARKLVDMAKRCGVDYVKIQKRSIKDCYSPEELATPCESPWGSTVGDKVRGRELSWSQIQDFDAHCRRSGMPWFASCFDLQSLADLHARYPRRDYNKVPSCMAVDDEFLRAVADQRIPAIVSTGLMTLDDMTAAASIFENARCRYVLAHCVALYPAPDDRLQLAVISTMRETFDDETRWPYCMAIGYSGHEVGLSTTTCAIALGAQYVERHVTLDRSMYGADQAASMEERGLALLVRDARKLERAHGDGVKRLFGDEKIPVKRRREST